MTIEQFREKVKAEPFQPFDIHMADGRRYHVASREFIALSPSGRTVTVYASPDASTVLDLLLMTGLEVRRNGPRHRQPR